MSKNSLQFSVFSFWLLVGIALAESGSMDSISLELWQSPEFQRRFAESYVAETEIEPTVTQSEREAMLKVLDLMAKDQMGKAKVLLEKNTNEAASAVFDFTLANLYLQENDPNLAMQGYEHAVAKHPKFRRAWNNLGLIYVQQTEYTKAIKALTRVIETGGGNALTYGMLGFAYLSLGDLMPAESAFRMAILLDRETLDWKMKLLYTQFKQGRYAEVASFCDRLIEEMPTRADLWLLQANAYIGLNEPLKAAVNYEMLDSLGASTLDSLNMLADIYVNESLFDVGVDTYIRALEIKPYRNSDRAVRAAKVLCARGELSEAKRLIAQIQNLHGNLLGTLERKSLLRLRARIAASEGSSGDEVKVLEEIVALDPLDGEALIQLGRHFGRTGDPEKAVFYYERAANLEQYEADAKVRHAQLLVSQGQYAEAIGLLKRAQALKPRDDVQKYLEQVERATKSR
ncbi:MAG: tetratricopeptide repeat protein [Phycisphaeraceae bacterium]|nr:tetratricopeptide repeat protein [Phycisphaeraceae bacterium]